MRVYCRVAERYCKVLNKDVHRMSMGPSCGTSGDQMMEREGCPGYVDQTCLLNPTHKHIEFFFTGY